MFSANINLHASLCKAAFSRNFCFGGCSFVPSCSVGFFYQKIITSVNTEQLRDHEISVGQLFSFGART